MCALFDPGSLMELLNLSSMFTPEAGPLPL